MPTRIAEFDVRVEERGPDRGEPTQRRRSAYAPLEPEKLKELVEGKFVDALRTAAAEMTMEELHERRGDYVKRCARRSPKT